MSFEVEDGGTIGGTIRGGGDLPGRDGRRPLEIE